MAISKAIIAISRAILRGFQHTLMELPVPNVWNPSPQGVGIFSPKKDGKPQPDCCGGRLFPLVSTAQARELTEKDLSKLLEVRPFLRFPSILMDFGAPQMVMRYLRRILEARNSWMSSR